MRPGPVRVGGVGRWLAPTALAVLGGALAWTSCAVPGFERVAGEPGAGGEGTGGGSSTGASGGSSGCQHATWPPRPAADDPGGDDVDLVVAVRRIDFGEEDLSQGPRIGYDLDNACTCAGDASSCVIPAWVDEERCDGPHGIDNSVSQLFSVLGAFASDFSSATESARAEQGNWSLLVRVSGYNGQPNDRQVRLALHPSPGLDEDTCLDDPNPKWDGSDAWPIDSVSLMDPGTGDGGAGGSGGGSCGGVEGYDLDQPRFVDAMAYVADGTLVANLPNAGLILSSDDKVTTIDLVAGFLTGKLVLHADGWHLEDGLLTGRWRVDDFFTMISGIETNNQPLCTDHPAYALLKNAVCQYPDIAATQGANPPCDAMSFGMGFEAEPAKMGIVFQSAGAPISQCPPETNPANDSCG